mmetsp:Transcript_5638/g.5837  ORF Transcript_5638/g.5837 Transcript_5638/m.5837 type:complete len:177 (+) Transcript_5638:76-606(+)
MELSKHDIELGSSREDTMKQKTTSRESHMANSSKRSKHNVSRRVVLVNHSNSVMSIPYINKPCRDNQSARILDRDGGRSKKRRRRADSELGVHLKKKSRMKSFSKPEHPSAPHNTNSIIIEAHGTPNKSYDSRDGINSYVEEDIDMYGSFLLHDSEEDVFTSGSDITDQESDAVSV